MPDFFFIEQRLGERPINERAKVFAEGFNRLSPDGVGTVHVYIDGLVMAVRGSPDRHLAIRDYLLKKHPVFEEARAGDISVFLVPTDVDRDTRPEDLPPIFVGATSGYNDHRLDCSFSVESALGLFSSALAASAAGDSQHHR